MRAVRVAERNIRVYLRTWRGQLFHAFLTPLLFLTSLGILLGSVIDRRNPIGVPYAAFVAPGVLAMAAMQAAISDGSWPLWRKLAIERNYDAMLSTPLSVKDIVNGEILSFGYRQVQISAVFLLVLAGFGYASFPLALLAIPVAWIMGLGFGAAMMAYAAGLERSDSFAFVHRYVTTPMLLTSGAFFPVDQLPRPVRPLAMATPLHHGVEAIRSLTLHQVDLGDIAIHFSYLVVFFVGALAVAHVRMRKRLAS